MENNLDKPRRPGVRGPDKRKRAVYCRSKKRTKYWKGPTDGRTLRGQPPYRFPTKLTADDVAWIKGAIELALKPKRPVRGRPLKNRAMLGRGILQRLADKHSVSFRTIRAIRYREIWRDVKPIQWDLTQPSERVATQLCEAKSCSI
jgi:hypothetical protein